MSAPTRRALLAGAPMAALIVGAAAPSAHPHADAEMIALCAAHATRSHPDAELIRICAQHIVNITTYNNAPSATERGCDEDHDPLWFAYEVTRDAISEAEPQTMDGMVAIARAAAAEAGPDNLDADDRAFHGMDEEWAWRLVGHLLRLHDAAGRA